MGKLTKRFIDALTPKATDYIAWDDELRGFGIRISPKGRKAFLVQYRAGGRSRRMRIGAFGVLTADEARLRAREVLGDVARGNNPAEVASTYRGAPTVADICDDGRELRRATRIGAHLQLPTFATGLSKSTSKCA